MCQIDHRYSHKMVIILGNVSLDCRQHRLMLECIIDVRLTTLDLVGQSSGPEFCTICYAFHCGYISFSLQKEIFSGRISVRKRPIYFLVPFRIILCCSIEFHKKQISFFVTQNIDLASVQDEMRIAGYFSSGQEVEWY